MECSRSAKLSFKSVCNCQHGSEILRSFAPTLKISTPTAKSRFTGEKTLQICLQHHLPNVPSCNSGSRPRGNPPTRSTYQMPNCQMPKSRNSPDNVSLTCINILWGYVCATHRPQVAGLCKKVDFNFSSCRSTVKNTYAHMRHSCLESRQQPKNTRERGRMFSKCKIVIQICL